MSKPKLIYFDFPGGRGEDCRLALTIANVDFEDDRVPIASWPERKAGTPYGALPVLELPGQAPLAQSNTILRLIGTKHDLHPTDPFVAVQHEAIMVSVEDVRARVNPNPGIEDAAAKEQFRTAFVEKTLIPWANDVEAQIGDGPFVAGSTLNVVDLKLFILMKWFIGGGVDHVPTEVFAKHTKLMRVYDSVKAHPKVVAWYAS